MRRYALCYVACCLAAWLTFADNWRQHQDLRANDALVAGGLSLLGPVSLGAAIGSWVATRTNGNPVIWQRRS